MVTLERYGAQDATARAGSKGREFDINILITWQPHGRRAGYDTAAT
jgi:hypothetical protein